jgi:hypothetical protein
MILELFFPRMKDRRATTFSYLSDFRNPIPGVDANKKAIGGRIPCRQLRKPDLASLPAVVSEKEMTSMVVKRGKI